MDLDSRNKWLVENMPSVCNTIQRYCDRDPNWITTIYIWKWSSI